MRRKSAKANSTLFQSAGPMALSMGVILSAAAGLFPHPACAASRPEPAESPATMDEPLVRHELAVFGYSDIVDLKQDGVIWMASVRKNGTNRTIRIDGLSGTLTDVTPKK